MALPTITPKQNATSPTLVGRFLLSHAVIFFLFSFFTTRRRSTDPGSWEVVRPPRSLSKHAVPLLLCSDPDSSNRNILNWQHTHATTHRRLGGSETSRRHAHLMSENDAHQDAFTECTRAWPLRPSTMSGQLATAPFLKRFLRRDYTASSLTRDGGRSPLSLVQTNPEPQTEGPRFKLRL